MTVSFNFYKLNVNLIKFTEKRQILISFYLKLMKTQTHHSIRKNIKKKKNL